MSPLGAVMTLHGSLTVSRPPPGTPGAEEFHQDVALWTELDRMVSLGAGLVAMRVGDSHVAISIHVNTVRQHEHARTKARQHLACRSIELEDRVDGVGVASAGQRGGPAALTIFGFGFGRFGSRDRRGLVAPPRWWLAAQMPLHSISWHLSSSSLVCRHAPAGEREQIRARRLLQWSVVFVFGSQRRGRRDVGRCLAPLVPLTLLFRRRLLETIVQAPSKRSFSASR